MPVKVMKYQFSSGYLYVNVSLLFSAKPPFPKSHRYEIAPVELLMISARVLQYGLAVKLSTGEGRTSIV
jgi:hypothetical protein